MKKFDKKYKEIITLENLMCAWKEFVRDKSKKPDVILFGTKLMDNLFDLHTDLKNKTYTHSPYVHFKINDPKPRDIHKARVRDRVLHHLFYNALCPFFDKTFIYDSYSCRFNKGTHKGIERFRSFVLKVSKNRTKQCFVLKCDIRKFFANINHDILKEILRKRIEDKENIDLLENIIDSFPKGLPLGNLTSQLLVNVYMNEFDQFIKRELKVTCYIRYADDFVILSEDKKYLKNLIKEVAIFLSGKLRLELHSNKVFIKTIYSGVDFLGWIEFGDHRVLRTSTNKRMMRRLQCNQKEESKVSYLGMLSHGNAYRLKKQISVLL